MAVEFTTPSWSDFPLQVGETLQPDGHGRLLLDTDPVLDQEVDEIVGDDECDGSNSWSKSVLLRTL